MCYVNLYRFNSIIYTMWDSISRQTVRCPTSVRHPISDCPLLLRISQQHKPESFKSKYHCLDLQLFLSGIVGTAAMAQLCSISEPPAFALLYALPFLRYYCENPSYGNLAFIPIMALSYYLAYNNNVRTELSETVHTLRDNSVEKEMMLKESTRHLVDSQNDQIYIATLKERNRIAREIHDNVGHMLSRSILQVGALLAICKDDTLKPHLTTLKESLDLAMNNIRNSVHDLHDESIDLQNALQGLVDSFTFCPVHFQCDISKQIPKNVKYCFLAITKEGMNNIMRHSNASRVTLTVKEHPAFYQLLIEDNGTTSFHSENVGDNGMGISNMKERAEALHGILHISTENGFRIFVSIPK